MKVNVQNQNEKGLLAFIKISDYYRIPYIEIESWEDFLELINKDFDYTQHQLDYLQKDFITRRTQKNKIWN